LYSVNLKKPSTGPSLYPVNQKLAENEAVNIGKDGAQRHHNFSHFQILIYFSALLVVLARNWGQLIFFGLSGLAPPQ
jgi:hypothetical protein